MTDLLKYKGVSINVFADGTFRASIDTDEINGTTLKQVKDRIDKLLAVRGKSPIDLPVIGINRLNELKATHLVGINRTTRALQFQPKTSELAYILADTAANRALLKDFADAKARFEQLKAEVEGFEVELKFHYGRIDIEDYDRHCNELKTAWNESSAPR